MSTFFPRFPEGDFAPLFRLLDDYDTHRSTATPGGHGGRAHSIRAFQPKFDVQEDKESYVLQGELPGIAQKDVDIQFTDAQTLVIKGRVEREHHAGSPPAGAIEGSAGGQKSIEEGGEGTQPHKATVEDEGEEGKEGKEAKEAKDAQDAQASNNHEKQVVHQQKKKEPQPQHKYWVTERSVGEFYRSFTFPGRVDQDGVKANLKDGILTVVVPKAVAKEAKKIRIE
jgi:HSP20 family protein